MDNKSSSKMLLRLMNSFNPFPHKSYMQLNYPYLTLGHKRKYVFNLIYLKNLPMHLQQLKRLISHSFSQRINLIPIEVGHIYTIQNVTPNELNLLRENGLNTLNQNHTNQCITRIEDIKMIADAIIQKESKKII